MPRPDQPSNVRGGAYIVPTSILDAALHLLSTLLAVDRAPRSRPCRAAGSCRTCTPSAARRRQSRRKIMAEMIAATTQAVDCTLAAPSESIRLEDSSDALQQWLPATTGDAA